MNPGRTGAVIACALGLTWCAHAFAHHSAAQFDQSQVVSLTGTVKDWQWANPHVWLMLVVRDKDGKFQQWGIEAQSPQVMRTQANLNRDMLKIGDRVTVRMHPRRDGSMGGTFVSVTFPDGHSLGLGH